MSTIITFYFFQKDHPNLQQTLMIHVSIGEQKAREVLEEHLMAKCII